MAAGAERAPTSREAARRQAVDTLNFASAVASYAARSMNGTGPEQARLAALEVAADLERVVTQLRRLARQDPGSAARRALAAELAEQGWSRLEIAAELGVTGETARRWLRSRPDVSSGR